MQRSVGLVAALAGLAFLAGSVRMGQLERGGPSHADLVLDGGVPASVYLPGPERGRAAFLDPPPRSERPPALVLVHGYAGDRRQLSGLARRIAASGIAVLAIDLAGHGENPNPFTGSDARGDAFQPDLGAAVEFLRAWPFVDGSRIAVGGHSMGAGASLDYATRDSGLDAVVLVSGGWRLTGPYPPPNVLFVVGEHDPERVRLRLRELAQRLSGTATVESGRSYGSPERHDAVRLVEVAGADHLSVLWSDQTLREIVDWLDVAFGQPPRHAPLPVDPRAALLPLLLLALLLLLPGLGLLLGRLVPPGRRRPAEGRLLGLGLLAVALFASLPLVAVGVPRVLPVQVGDVVVWQFALAGLGLLLALRLRWREYLAGVAPRPLASVAGAGLGVVAIAALMQPLSGVLHGVLSTPERGAVFVAATLGLLPLAFATSVLLRRGGTAGAAVAALGGRLLLLLVLITGARLGVLPRVVLLMVPTLAVLSVFLEVLASSVYAASRNLLTIAILDAAWVAVVLAAVLPVRA